jgi:histidinol phosphatase-like enzyme
MSPKKLKILIDFDGTICKEGKFVAPHIIPFGPEPFAVEAIKKLSDYFTIVVYSVRAQSEGGKKAIEVWMKKYGIPFSKVTNKKEMAVLYIDNRAIRYTGDWKKTLSEVATFDAK